MSEPTEPPPPPDPAQAAAEPKPAAAKSASQPYRVQGMHVADFAKRLADKMRNIALLCGAVGFVLGLGIVRTMAYAGTVEKAARDDTIIIAIAIFVSVMGYRHFQRSRLLQSIAEAAQREPIAVWGVKDTWLYPLDPKLDRKKLSITLDAKEHKLIYQKPRAPIVEPAEPLP